MMVYFVEILLLIRMLTIELSIEFINIYYNENYYFYQNNCRRFDQHLGLHQGK